MLSSYVGHVILHKPQKHILAVINILGIKNNNTPDLGLTQQSGALMAKKGSNIARY